MAVSFYVKSIATYAPAFLEYNNSVLARVKGQKISKATYGVLNYSKKTNSVFGNIFLEELKTP